MGGKRIFGGMMLGWAALTLGACVPANAPRGLLATSEPLPPLPPTPPPPPRLVITTVPQDTLEAAEAMRSVTLTAVDVDIRALLPALAEAADMNLVMGPQVQGRVTVNFVDVPADEAIKLVLAEAGLILEQPPFRSPWAPVVFYALPVNINTAEADLLRARYHVSPEMARWIVESRSQ